MFLFCLVFAMFCARLFICASWSPAGKGLTSWLSFEAFSLSLSLSHFILGQVWYLIVSIPDLCNLTYFGLTETKLFYFHMIFNRGRGEGERTPSGSAPVMLSQSHLLSTVQVTQLGEYLFKGNYLENSLF